MAVSSPPAHTHAQSDRLAPPSETPPRAIRAALNAEGAVVPDGERCPTCHAVIRVRYCPVCGETRPSRQPDSVAGFLQGAISRLLDADNRLFRALHRLLLRPGALTVAFLNGRRRPFLGPLQLFVTINVAYFFVAASAIGLDALHTPLRIHVTANNFYHQSMAQRWVSERIGAPDGWSYSRARAMADSLIRAGADFSARADVPARASQEAFDAFQSYAERFNRQVKWLSKSLVFLFIPTLTGWLWLLYPSRWGHPRHRGLLAPLVQATHLWSAALILAALSIIPLVLAYGVASILGVRVVEDAVLSISFAAFLTVYATVALRRVQGGTGRRAWLGAGLRAVATLWALYQFLFGYRAVLFVVGYYTT